MNNSLTGIRSTDPMSEGTACCETPAVKSTPTHISPSNIPAINVRPQSGEVQDVTATTTRDCGCDDTCCGDGVKSTTCGCDSTCCS